MQSSLRIFLNREVFYLAELSTKAISELLDNPELADILVEPCACGSTRALSLGLNALMCTDRCCPFRIASRLYAIVEKYQAVHLFSLSDLEFICQDRYYRTWVDFFTDDWEDTQYVEAHSTLVQLIKSDVDVPIIAMMSGFDCLSSDQVYNMLGDFQSVSDLADVLDSDGMLFISERLGLTAAHLIPVAIHIYNVLGVAMTDMLEAETQFMQ